jgi:hypothetical protein
MKNVITCADRLADGVAIGLAFCTDVFFGYADACLAQRPCADEQPVPTARGRRPLDWLP